MKLSALAAAPGRNASTVREDLKYLIEGYGASPALLRVAGGCGCWPPCVSCGRAKGLSLPDLIPITPLPFCTQRGH